MGEFWGFVDWGAGCLALIVAVVFSFLLGVRTGRIRERNESVRSRIRQNKANMYRYKQQLASYQEQVVRLERERDSLVIRSEAYDRIETELTAYRRWLGLPPVPAVGVITQEAVSPLNVHDADSDILLPSEHRPLTAEEYEALKALALRSAEDFLTLYRSIPDKTHTTLPQRETFYGDVPLTAEEMYRHTKNVNAYYFGEIGVEVGNEPDILICRRAGFAALERQPRYLHNAVFHGSYDEDWTLRKVLRRFVWHDRIHGRAMWRMACALCGSRRVADPYRFA